MKNIDYVIKKVSSNRSLPQKLVEDIYKFYWKEGVLDGLRASDHTAFSVPKIGTFFLSYIKICAEIRDIIKRLRVVRGTEKYTVGKRKEIDLYYCNYLRKLLERKNELSEERNIFLKKMKNAGKIN